MEATVGAHNELKQKQTVVSRCLAAEQCFQCSVSGVRKCCFFMVLPLQISYRELPINRLPSALFMLICVFLYIL